MTNSDNLWSIQLPSGDIRKGTIDQLDDAFQSGAIAASTPVLAPGETNWTTLGALAGLDTAGTHPSHIREPAAPPAQPEERDLIPPANSLRPVTSDSDDFDFAVPTPPRSKRWVMGVLGLAAAAGIAGIAFTTLKHGGPTADAAVAPPAPLTSVPVYETPHPTAQAVDLANSPTAGVQLSEAQRKQIEAERAHPTKPAAGRAAGAATQRSGRSAKGGDPFSAKGSKGNCQCNAGDPLCSCL